MNLTRYCQFKGHEGNPATYLCTFIDCKLNSKWICVDCGVQQIHNHGQPNQNHLMKQQQFIDFINQQSQTMLFQKHQDKRLTQICIKEFQKIIQITQFLMQRLQEDLETIEKNYNLEEIEQISNMTKDNYFLLENIQIEKIIKMNNKNNKKFQYNLSQDVIQQIIEIDKDLQQLLKENFRKYNAQIYQIIQPNEQLVYQRHFECQQDDSILTSQISQDEKYLIFGGVGKIQVYEILTKQLLKSIKIDNKANICRFTKNSKYLICGDYEGYLYCFYTHNNFNQQYRNKIHSSQIKDILPINNNQIISCSFDKSIKITNITQRTQQLLITNAHNYYINSVDFDQQNDIIISCSNDKSIKFFNKTNGVMQFEKKDAHDYRQEICQIQLVSNQKNNLLSSGWSNIILWQIDYDKKQLKKIKVLYQKHYNFTSVNNNRIILISVKEVQILDQNLNQVQSINNNLYFGSVFIQQLHYFLTRQINSMNYIIVPGCRSLQVFKKE